MSVPFRHAFHGAMFLPALLSILSLPATAADDDPTTALEPVTVTASRYERPLNDTPASVTVLDAEDLAPWAAQPVEDILAVRGGVTLARTGGDGQQVSVFLRGTNSDSVLVLVDGVKINGATFGGANFQNLRGADIERIEIVRGPRSTLYGSEAIGGVISITTRRGSDTAGTATAVDSIGLRAERGDDNTHDLRAHAAHDNGDFHFAAGIGEFSTDGDPVTDRTDITGRHHNVSGSLNLSNKLGDTRVGFDGWAARGTTRYVDCSDFLCTAIVPFDQMFRSSTAGLWSETPVGETLKVRARLGHAGDEIEQLDSNDFAQTDRLIGTIELEHRTGGNVLVAGLDGEREDVDAIIYGGPLTAQNKNRAVFARDEFTWNRQQFALGLRGTEYDTFGGHTTGEASYGLHIGDNGYGWIAGGRGFRAPDATERFGFGGNPDLDPEQTDSAEIGLRWRFGAQEFTLTGYEQRIDDLIDYPAPTFTATNIARARITGAEAGWSWHDAVTRIDTLLTLQDPVNEDTGERLSRRPKQQFTTTVSRRIGAFELRGNLLAMDHRDNSAFDSVQLPGFAVVDLGLAWKLQPQWTIEGRIRNVGDIDYALASGNVGDFMMPDRAFFMAIDWHPSKAWTP